MLVYLNLSTCSRLPSLSFKRPGKVSYINYVYQNGKHFSLLKTMQHCFCNSKVNSISMSVLIRSIIDKIYNNDNCQSGAVRWKTPSDFSCHMNAFSNKKCRQSLKVWEGIR